MQFFYIVLWLLFFFFLKKIESEVCKKNFWIKKVKIIPSFEIFEMSTAVMSHSSLYDFGELFLKVIF